MTTDHSGILDVFTQGKNGYCVDKRSPVSIRQAIEQAVTEPTALYRMALINLSEAESLYRVEHFNTRLIRIVESMAL